MPFLVEPKSILNKSVQIKEVMLEKQNLEKEHSLITLPISTIDGSKKEENIPEEVNEKIFSEIPNKFPKVFEEDFSYSILSTFSTNQTKITLRGKEDSYIIVLTGLSNIGEENLSKISFTFTNPEEAIQKYYSLIKDTVEKEEQNVDMQFAIVEEALRNQNRIIRPLLADLNKAKIYIHPERGEKPPEGAEIKEGPRKGKYYETGHKLIENTEKVQLDSPVIRTTDIHGGSNEPKLLELENSYKGIFKAKKDEFHDLRTSIPSGTYYKREILAYKVSKLLGFDFCPVTVKFTSKESGVGSIQKFIDNASEVHNLVDLDVRNPEKRHVLEDLAFFDMVIGNTDRHSGNAIKDVNGKIWAIDNGLAFPSYNLGISSIFIRSLQEEKIPKRLLSKIENTENIKKLCISLVGNEATKSTINRIKKILERGFFSDDFD